MKEKVFRQEEIIAATRNRIGEIVKTAEGNNQGLARVHAERVYIGLVFLNEIGLIGFDKKLELQGELGHAVEPFGIRVHY